MTLTVSLTGQGTSVVIIREVGTATFTKPIEGRFTLSTGLGASGQTTSVQMLIVGSAVYFQEDGAWYSMTLSTVEAHAGVSGSIESESPVSTLDLLYQEGAGVTRVGHRELNGVKTTEYRATVNLDKKFRAPNGVSFSQKYIDGFKKLVGSTKLPLRIWVDSSGKLRQEKFELPLSKSGLKEMGLKNAPNGMKKMVMTADLSDFGVAVTVQKPSTATPINIPTGVGTKPAT